MFKLSISTECTYVAAAVESPLYRHTVFMAGRVVYVKNLVPVLLLCFSARSPMWLGPFQFSLTLDTLILKTRPTELRVASSALSRAPCGHGRCS